MTWRTKSVSAGTWTYRSRRAEPRGPAVPPALLHAHVSPPSFTVRRRCRKVARKRRAEARRLSGLSGLQAGPEQVEGAVLHLDEVGVDRRQEARIIQLDREVIPAAIRGLFPPGTQLKFSCEHTVSRSVRTSVGQNAYVEAERQGLDFAVELAVSFGEYADGRHAKISCFSGRQSASMARRRPAAGACTPLAAVAQQRTEAGGYFKAAN